MMKFEEIVTMSQSELMVALPKELKSIGYRPTGRKKFIYAKGTVPVMLVAHMDVVHQTLPTENTIMSSKDGRFYSAIAGIGGDDRCGVWMILEIIKKQKCHVLFTTDEESGGHGAHAFVKSLIKPKVNYLVQIDRRGHNDAVFYACDNKEFTEFVEGFKFETQFGSFSDISIIAPALEIAAVNISAGYYNEHTTHEVVDMDAMKHNVERICNMASTKTEKFEYVANLRDYTAWRYGDMYGDTYAERYCYDDHFKYKIASSPKIQQMMLVPRSADVVSPSGHDCEEGVFLVDQLGSVYEWATDLDDVIVVKVPRYKAVDQNGKQLYADTKNTFSVEVVTEDELYELLDAHDRREAGITWREIYNEYGEDYTAYYMDAVSNETGEYPVYEDIAPEWVYRQMLKGA